MMRFVVLGLCLSLAGCMMPPAMPPKTPLQVREIQSRDFDTTNSTLVMKALLNVLQDEGFVTRNAVTDLGLITATREANARDTSAMVFGSIILGNDASWPQTNIVEATANVSPYGSNHTRVRLTFKEKQMDNRGAVFSVKEIQDPNYYQNFFAKVDKGLFIERSGI